MSCACGSLVPIYRSKALCRSQPEELGTQRRIHRQFGASGSTYAKMLGALTVAHGVPACGGATWHQASDRATMKKGGVDVKHNSYARYLGKRTGRLYLTEASSKAAKVAKSGGKVRMVGLGGGCGGS